MGFVLTPAVDRTFAKVSYRQGCWEFTGGKDRLGYGRVNNRPNSDLAHRIVYEALVGPIPDGYVLDHLCRNPSCVNPTHLEPVPFRENIDRGANKRDHAHCARGHEYTPENTRRVAGPHPKRVCAECKRGWSAKYKAAKR